MSWLLKKPSRAGAGHSYAELENVARSCLQRRTNKEPYVDASCFPDPDPFLRSKTREGPIEPFPVKLHRIFEETAAAGQHEVISLY
jgi:hypothetical protein